MKIKENLDVTTDDFYYDLFMGGYLEPEKICKFKKDAKRVRAAMEVLKDFEQSCEDQIEDFFR